jgi:hypothetical protein
MATPHIHTAFANNTSYVPMLRVRGLSGILKGLGIAGAPRFHYVRVTIDGATLVDEYLAANLISPAPGNTGFVCDLPFADELVIEIRDLVPSPQARFWVSYLLYGFNDDYAETEKTEAIESIADIEYLVAYERAGDDFEIARLRNARREAIVVLDTDTWIPGRDEEVSGSVLLRDYREPVFAEYGVPVVIRRSGYTRPLLETSADRSAERFRFSVPSRVIRAMLADFGPFGAPGLEVATDLPGYANYPTALI